MALVLADRVKETTTTTGTGDISLGGAETNFVAFGSALSDGDTTYYAIVDDGNADFEVGIGTYTSGTNSLSRDTVFSSTNGGSLVDLGAGTKSVFITYPAEKSIRVGSDISDLTNDSGFITTATTIGTTAPSSPSAGDLWWNSESGQLKVYYTDADSSQWVDAAASAASDVTTAVNSATSAATSETNAASSATSAASSATTATTKASEASASASAAATSETNAASSASAAATSETNAATSETNAASSASSASTSATQAASSLDQFEDIYLGAKATDPTVDNDGDALVEGALYWNTTDSVLKGYTGTEWLNIEPLDRSLVELSGNGSVTCDLSATEDFKVSMTANSTLTFSNVVAGKTGVVYIVQDAVGGHSFTLSSICKTPKGGAAIVQTTGANTISLLSYTALDSSNVLVNYIGDFA